MQELLPMRGAQLADAIQRTGALGLTLGSVSFSQPMTLTPALDVFLREMDGLTATRRSRGEGCNGESQVGLGFRLQVEVSAHSKQPP